MKANLTPSLRAALERLKHAGSVSGIAFGWRRQLLINLTPYQDFRMETVLDIVHNAGQHFATSEREVDTFWFGYEGVQMLTLRHRDSMLILLHTRLHEVDAIRSAGLTMLEDSQLLISDLLNPRLDHSGDETQQLEVDLMGTADRSEHGVTQIV